MQIMAILLALTVTVAQADPAVQIGAGVCSDSWVSRLCEKWLYKGEVYIIILDDGEIFRIVHIGPDGEELIYQAPKRYWI